MVCGNATCRCHKNPQNRHGPYHYWTRKSASKTVGMMLTEDELPVYREWRCQGNFGLGGTTGNTTGMGGAVGGTVGSGGVSSQGGAPATGGSSAGTVAVGTCDVPAEAGPEPVFRRGRDRVALPMSSVRMASR
jgi:hypothetical protein